jgi:CBS domain-containing protein
MGRISIMPEIDRTVLELTAEDLMSRTVITLTPDMLLPDAARVLAQAHIGGAPVIDGAGRCIGVFTTADIARLALRDCEASPTAPAVPGCGCSDWQRDYDWDDPPVDYVDAFMTPNPLMVPPTTPVKELARRMVDGHIHRLIVAGPDCRPLGIVSGTDVLAALACAARAQE